MRVAGIFIMLAPLNLLLSSWYIGYFHMVGHIRFVSKFFVSGLAIGLGFVLYANAYGRSDPEPSESEGDHPGNSGQKR